MKAKIFYGAGKYAYNNMESWMANGEVPDCICDSDVSMHHTFFEYKTTKVKCLPQKILPFTEAINKYNDYEVVITSINFYVEIFDYLCELGVEKHNIRSVFMNGIPIKPFTYVSGYLSGFRRIIEALPEVRDSLIDTSLKSTCPILFTQEDITGKYDLYDSHLKFFETLTELFNFTGKRVLEIGGSNYPYSFIDKMDVEKWLCVDYPNWTSNRDEGYTSDGNHYERPIPIFKDEINVKAFLNNPDEKYGIFAKLTSSIGNELNDHFDIVVSKDSFEHIFTIDETLKKIYLSLRQGGVLFSSFRLVYSSSKGNHFRFKMPDSSYISYSDINWLPPYVHLTHSFKDIYIELLKHFNENEINIEELAHDIKRHSSINKLFYEDYQFLLNRSDFKHKYIMSPTHYDFLTTEMLEKLMQLYPGYKAFDAVGAMLLAQKV